MKIRHRLKKLPKYLFISCKRSIIFGRRMSGPARRCSRPVTIQRYACCRQLIKLMIATCIPCRNIEFIQETGDIVKYQLQGFIVGTPMGDIANYVICE